MVKYRKAEEKDKEGIPKVLLKNYNIKNLEEAKQIFMEDLSRYDYIVAEENGKIAGIGCWRVHGLPKHQVAEIGRVAVLPEKKGTGTATDIFSKVAQKADKFYKTHKSKLRKIYAYVHSSNKKAQEFYSGVGLIKEAVLKDHYYKGEDEFVYSMFLD